MDRIGCFAVTGSWPESCVAGTARVDFAGWHPREAWSASCRNVAGSLRCPCGTWGPCGRPVVAAFGQARPRGQGGNRFMAGRRSRSRRRVSPVRALRGCRRAGGRRPPVTPRATCTCRVFTRRSRVRVPRFRRRCAASLVWLRPCGPTLPLRSELAGSGRNYGRRPVVRANACVNGWRARCTVGRWRWSRTTALLLADCSRFVADWCSSRAPVRASGARTSMAADSGAAIHPGTCARVPSSWRTSIVVPRNGRRRTTSTSAPARGWNGQWVLLGPPGIGQYVAVLPRDTPLHCAADDAGDLEVIDALLRGERARPLWPGRRKRPAIAGARRGVIRCGVGCGRMSCVVTEVRSALRAVTARGGGNGWSLRGPVAYDWEVKG